KELGAAQLLFQAANAKGMPGHERLGEAMDNLALQRPDLVIWGSEAGGISASPNTNTETVRPKVESIAPLPFTEFVVRSEQREKLLAQLTDSTNPAAHELLRFRALTNTVIFSPSPSASGQALDSAILICGLLLEE